MKVTTTVRGTAIGIDLGSRKCDVCVRKDGRIVGEFAVSMDHESLVEAFEDLPRGSVLIEACTVSLWVSRVLEELGFDVIVADPHRIATELRGRRKSDKKDARLLALFCERGPEFYHRIRHRSKPTMVALRVVRSRDLLVRQRTSLICSVKQTCLIEGVRIRASATSFAKHACAQIPADLFEAVEPTLRVIDQLSKSIREYDARIARLSRRDFPQTELLRQVHGVGPITSLLFTLIFEDPGRFRRNRQAGAFVGLVPRQRESSSIKPQLSISKAGDPMLRRLLVQCAQCIMKSNAPDSDLKRAGEAIASRGGKNAKKRAVVAVARKLAVLMLALWKTGEVYEPLRNSPEVAVAA